MRLPSVLRRSVLALLLFSPALRAADPADAFFGKETASEAALMGILYDLKQSQDRKPTGIDAQSYLGVIDNFFSRGSGFDETALLPYYRTTRPLYTTQIYIPLMSADAAPKAFGVAKIVRPSRWIIHYKGQVLPPEDGTYRFAGYADDVIVVAVDGKLVLNGSRIDSRSNLLLTKWKSTEGPGLPAGNGTLIMGDWMPLSASKPIDLDIIIGERPGGQFCAFLLYEKQGETYPASTNPAAKGRSSLPLFQVAPYEGKPLVAGKDGVDFVQGKIWKCLQ